MSRRQWVSLALSAVLLLGLISCQNGGGTESGSKTGSKTGSAGSGIAEGSGGESYLESGGQSGPGASENGGASGAGRSTGGSVSSKGGGGGGTGSSGGSTPGKVSKYGASGDTSFKITTAGLKKNTVYLISKNAVKAPGGSIMQHDSARLFVSLQGLINRDLMTSRIALVVEPTDSSETFWLDYVEKKSAVLSGMTTVKINSFDAFLNTFAQQIKACGMVLWDPAVPSTANVAATICGLDGFLPVKYDKSSAGLQAKLQAMGAKTKVNLVNKFSGKGIIPDTKTASTGSKKCDAYLWAMEKYMPRCSSKYMLYMPDGASCVETNPIYLRNTYAKDPFASAKICNHDYGIARRAFFFDLTPVDSEAPCDDPGQVFGTDLKTMEKLLLRRYELAGGEWGETVGFPPFTLKYTTYNNWGSIADTSVEAMYTSVISKFNAYLDADGSVFNCSVFYHFPLKSSYKNGNKAVTETYDPNTVYLYYHIGDYDGANWVLNYMWQAYENPARGSAPITWAVNPGLSDRIPMAFDYFYSNLSPKDTICASDSGVGYMRPQYVFQDKSLADSRTIANGGAQYVSYTKKYFDRFDIDAVSFIIGYMSPQVYAMYNQIAPVGSFHYDRAKPITIYKGVPYVPTKNGIGNPGENYNTSAQGMYDYLKTTMKGYNFAAFRTIRWTPAQLNTLSETFINYAKSKDPSKNYKFVNAYNFMALVKQSGQATIVN